MKTIILLSGGLGRGVAALPALIKFNRNNPDLDWYVSIPSWDYIGDCIPEIQHRIFDASNRNAWEHIFLKADVVITPEPYTLPNFYKGDINLVEAFDELINNTTDHSDLDYECLRLSGHELDQGKNVIMSIYDIYKKRRTVVINPYGSTAIKTRWGVRDETYRSMSEDLFYKLCEKLVEKYNVIFMGNNDLLLKDFNCCYPPKPDPHMRIWMATISQVDYFIGCDTSGQHIARSLGKRGCVFMGGTSKNSYSYPDHFLNFQKREPSPLTFRLSQTQYDLANNLNHDMMDYDDDEIETIFQTIVEDIESYD